MVGVGVSFLSSLSPLGNEKDVTEVKDRTTPNGNVAPLSSQCSVRASSSSEDTAYLEKSPYQVSAVYLAVYVYPASDRTTFDTPRVHSQIQFPPHAAVRIRITPPPLPPLTNKRFETVITMLMGPSCPL